MYIFSATKFGFMPELTWDGKVLGQSIAVARFVAREVGIAGRNNLEMAQCDAIVDFCCEVVEGKIQMMYVSKCQRGRDRW